MATFIIRIATIRYLQGRTLLPYQAIAGFMGTPAWRMTSVVPKSGQAITDKLNFRRSMSETPAEDSEHECCKNNHKENDWHAVS